ncbi:hypothetical protein [Streptomyces griseocarneus]|uniref:hypothetical protein n=1 Tax=Streptomyces griseocarneus TaxID=51201 RepID=UPI00167E2525|nr:hypothetical protein [Streptomyces griseocarneus]MBZ6477918.1 hypothetical protein [Streptomyces griseocarneus]GHG54258.1 hypothetical protein GCM10018779_17060 [Streptomyces griseocarneus]
MEKHPPQKSTLVPAETEDAPAAPTSRKTIVRRWLIGVTAAGALCWTFSVVFEFFENLGGGPVRSAADFRKQDIRTREAGRQTIGDLRPGTTDRGWIHEEGSTSCVDDLGFDSGSVTRKQPRYEWKLRYAGKADYLADLDKLRSSWEHRGWKTHDKPPPEPLNSHDKTPRWPGIRTTDDHGVTIAVGIDGYTGSPTLSTDGGCIRYDLDDRVAARKRTGATDSKHPGRQGTVTYADGVQVTIGPVQSVTPTPELTGDATPPAHAYRVPVTVKNRSGAPVELRSHDMGSYEGANPGVQRLTSYPSELSSGGPDRVSEGSTTRLEYVFTAETEPSRLELTYGPGEFHAPSTWELSIP